ncbi:MAG: hypothetical protein JO332_08320 [Planctomycetaceae bacterium]|nr:hypothetical protein [Planctomycetaceae bacterium]
MIRIDQIDSQQKLLECLSADQALVFVYFSWSGQSQASLQMFEKLPDVFLGRPSRMAPRDYRVDPDQEGGLFLQLFGTDPQHPMLTDCSDGPVLWISQGRIIDYARYAGQLGLEGLLLKTEKAFNGPELRK